MPTANVNGVRLFYELSGSAEISLVLVHGAWSSHRNFDRVVPGLAKSFSVVAYDRRGHSQSERPAGQGRMSEDVADLAALVEHLNIGPAWVVRTSAGANIALRLASQQPEILRGIIAHEPGFFSLFKGDSTFSYMLDKVDQVKGIVLERIAKGDHAGAAQYFIEANLGPGGWERTPAQLRQTYIENAPTFLDDMKDPEHFAFDPNWFNGSLGRFCLPGVTRAHHTSPRSSPG